MTKEQRAKIAALRQVWMHPAADVDRRILAALSYLEQTTVQPLEWRQLYNLDRLVWRYRRQLVRKIGELSFELPLQEPQAADYRAAAQHLARLRAEKKAQQGRLL